MAWRLSRWRCFTLDSVHTHHAGRLVGGLAVYPIVNMVAEAQCSRSSTLGIPIAAGVLYPFFGLLLSPIIAGAAMSLSSVSGISNALRLRNTNL